MNQEKSWIKISDRKPTESDLPVVMGARLEGGSWTQIFCGNLLMTDKSWTHWYPMSKIPEAPPEVTQEEKDLEASRWWRNNTLQSVDVSTAFASGLKHERSEIRRLIERHRNGEIIGAELIRLIFGRVKL